MAAAAAVPRVKLTIRMTIPRRYVGPSWDVLVTGLQTWQRAVAIPKPSP
jgi:hypothetical protein